MNDVEQYVLESVYLRVLSKCSVSVVSLFRAAGASLALDYIPKMHGGFWVQNPEFSAAGFAYGWCGIKQIFWNK